MGITASPMLIQRWKGFRSGSIQLESICGLSQGKSWSSRISKWRGRYVADCHPAWPVEIFEDDDSVN